MTTHLPFVAVSVLGLLSGAGLALHAAHAARRQRMHRALFGLLLAYCALLTGPASQLYGRVDAWQDLTAIGRAMGRDAANRPLILFAADETTRGFVDMYARTEVELIPGPIAERAAESLRLRLMRSPQSLVVAQLQGRRDSQTFRQVAHRLGVERLLPAPSLDVDRTPAWASDLHLRIAHSYALPNGRRYILLESSG